MKKTRLFLSFPSSLVKLFLCLRNQIVIAYSNQYQIGNQITVFESRKQRAQGEIINSIFRISETTYSGGDVIRTIFSNIDSSYRWLLFLYTYMSHKLRNTESLTKEEASGYRNIEQVQEVSLHSASHNCQAFFLANLYLWAIPRKNVNIMSFCMRPAILISLSTALWKV